MSTSDDTQGILGRSTLGVEDGVCFRDLAGKENLLQGQSGLSERHTYLSSFRPVPKCSRRDAKDVRSFCNFHVFTQFGHNSSPDRLEFDVGRKFSKLYSEMTALQMS